MKGSRLVRAAGHLIPAAWRSTVTRDLEDEAISDRHGGLWYVWHCARVALLLQLSFGVDAFGTDLRQSVRSLFRAKGLAIAGVFTFAIGVGANIAVFSLFDRILFRPLPYAHPEGLVQVHSSVMTSGALQGAAVIPSDVTRALVDARDLFAGVAWAEGNVLRSLPGSGESPLVMTSVTFNLLDVLGVSPILGRNFIESDRTAGFQASTAEIPVILAYDTWRRRFGAAPDVLSLSWKSGSVHYRVVGVLPGDFVLPSARLIAEPLDALMPTSGLRPVGQPQGVTDYLPAPFVRLRSSVSLAAAQAQVDTLVAARFANLHWIKGGAQPGQRKVLLQPLQSGMFMMVRPYLWLVFGGVWAVLAVTCFSVSALLFTWARSRQREAGIRLALGATPARLVRVAFLDSLLLCAAGSGVGWFVHVLTQSLLVAVVPQSLRGFGAGPSDLRVAVAAIGTACVGTVIAGMVPALLARRTNVLSVLDPLRESSHLRSLRPAATLLAVQAAFAVVVVVGAAATVPGFLRMLRFPGFDRADLFVLEIPHNASDDASLNSPAGILRIRMALEAVTRLPGATAAGVAAAVPLTTGTSTLSPFWRAQGFQGRTGP